MSTHVHATKHMHTQTDRRFVAVVLALGACAGGAKSTPTMPSSDSSNAVSMEALDAKLVRSLPGFKNEYATVNGVRLHYVIGGNGAPLVLLPGWPETWWEFHKMLPALAAHYTVIVVDLRGQGSSEKPAGGYDKKTMARDIYELTQKLGFPKVYVAGHDIGAAVGFSFAANYPGATRKLVLFDIAPADKFLMTVPLLPVAGTFGDKLDRAHQYPWWFAFHQVKGLPEKILVGRAALYQAWFFRYLLVDESAIGPEDRDVYAAAYNTADAIRAGDAWYQAFSQDAIDNDGYPKLAMPMLGLAGHGYMWQKFALPNHATNVSVVEVPNCGHFVPEEQPDFATRSMIEFFDKP